MNLLSARNLAEQLMEQHGVKSQGWRFAFDESKTHFGCCEYKRKVIFLSRLFTLTINEDKVKDTILHEIAHALTPGHHHDIVWKNVAKSIGCRGERCGDIVKEAISDTKLEQFKKAITNYSYTCPECNNIIHHKKLFRNAYCTICNKKTGKILQLKIKKI